MKSMKNLAMRGLQSFGGGGGSKQEDKKVSCLPENLSSLQGRELERGVNFLFAKQTDKNSSPFTIHYSLKHWAFTLAEMMVVLLIVSIVLACMAPVMTTKMKADQNNIQASPWRWSQNNIDAYFSVAHDNNQSAMIGQNTKANWDTAKLIINNSTMDDMILFKSGDNVLGRIRFQNGSVRLGNSDNALPQNSVEVGIGTTVSDDNSVAIGSGATVNAGNSVAMGNGATVNAGNSVAMGSGATVNDENSIAIGNDSTVNNPYSVAVGDGATAAHHHSTAIGANSNASGYLSVAIGKYAQATGMASIALGQTHDVEQDIDADHATQARNRWSIAIGAWTVAGIKGEDPVNGESFQTAIGSYSGAIRGGAVAINGTAIPLRSIAIRGKVGEGTGTDPDLNSGGKDGIAIGSSSNTTADNGIAIGTGTDAIADNGVAIGSGVYDEVHYEFIYGARVSDNYGIAIGTGANSAADNGIAIGKFSYILGKNGIAIGGGDTEYKGAHVLGNNGIAIGYGAKAPRPYVNDHGENIAIGYQAMAEAPDAGNINDLLSSSVAIGHQALLKTSGQENIGIGNSALVENTTGAQNVALGHRALVSNTTGHFNVAVGAFSLDGLGGVYFSNTTGSNNTAIGYKSCRAIRGSNKTCIGAYSGPERNSDLAAEGNEDKVIFLGDKDTTVYIPGNLVVGEKTTLNSQAEIGADAFKATAIASDRRLKYVGKENTDGLAKLRQLKIFNYTYKKDKTKTPHVGVIAQDLQKIFPNAVKKAADGFLTIRMEDIFYAVINAIKELDAKYRAQEKRIKALENENKELRARLEKLEANYASSAR